MNESDVQTLVDTAPLPPGMTLTVKPRRKYKYRNLWTVAIVRDGAVIWHRDAYNVAATITAASKVAWSMSGTRA